MRSAIRDLLSVFNHDHLWLKALSIVFVVTLITGHVALPFESGLALAAGLSVLMNLTYLAKALVTRSGVWVESSVSISLISISVAGVLISPWLLVLAVFGHGAWDLLKHFGGAGVRFVSWYCLGCVIVDWTWAAALSFWILAQT